MTKDITLLVEGSDCWIRARPPASALLYSVQFGCSSLPLEASQMSQATVCLLPNLCGGDFWVTPLVLSNLYPHWGLIIRFRNQRVNFLGITNNCGMFFIALVLRKSKSHMWACPETVAFKRQPGFQTFWEPGNHQMGNFPFTDSCQREQEFCFLTVGNVGANLHFPISYCLENTSNSVLLFNPTTEKPSFSSKSSDFLTAERCLYNVIREALVSLWD